MTHRIVETVERLSEILFGLIMTLTITGAVGVATADSIQIHHMVIAALGCNVAWGIIDAGMYLMARLGERGRNARMAKVIRETPDPKSAHSIIANALPSLLASIFGTEHLEMIRERINQMSPSDLRPKLTGRDFLGASEVCILVILSTFPVVLPLVVLEDARLALRASNAIAIISCSCADFFSVVMPGFGRGERASSWLL